MKFDSLKNSYRDQLIQAGVAPQKAIQAAKNLTGDELRLISEIWAEWAAVLSNKNRAS